MTKLFVQRRKYWIPKGWTKKAKIVTNMRIKNICTKTSAKISARTESYCSYSEISPLHFWSFGKRIKHAFRMQFVLAFFEFWKEYQAQLPKNLSCTSVLFQVWLLICEDNNCCSAVTLLAMAIRKLYVLVQKTEDFFTLVNIFITPSAITKYKIC